LLGNGQIELAFDLETGQVVRVTDQRRYPAMNLIDATGLTAAVPAL